MNDFVDLWVTLTPKQKQQLAKKVNSSVAYLSQIAWGHREPSLKMIKKLAKDRRIKTEMFL